MKGDDNMKKKIVAAILTAVAALAPVSVHAYTFAAEDGINVRTGPGTEYPIAEQLTAGTPVAVGDWDPVGNGWTLINTPNGAMFVYNQLLANLPDWGWAQSVADTHASGTGRLIVVDTQGVPRVYVFSGGSYCWTPEASFECSVGKPTTPTPAGEFMIRGKRESMYSSTSEEYWVSDFAYDENWSAWAFHSTLFAPGTWNPIDTRLRGHISDGCVRLSPEDAQWIYENCGYGTSVVIFKEKTRFNRRRNGKT